MAFGDHAAHYYETTPPTLRTLTGTSVSTAVVSAAAAVRWRRNPNLSSFEVMEALWDEHQEHEVEMPVDFWLKSSQAPPQKARRIFVYSPPEPTPWPAGMPTFDESALPDPIPSIDFSTLIQEPHCQEPLKSPGSPEPEAELCPQRLVDVKAGPWMGPQPGSNHCPSCTSTFGSPGTLLFEFDPSYRVEGLPAQIEDLTLIVGGVAYRLPKESFMLGDPSQPSHLEDDPVRVVFTDFPVGDPLTPMYLAVRVNGKLAALSPILQVIE